MNTPRRSLVLTALAAVLTLAACASGAAPAASPSPSPSSPPSASPSPSAPTDLPGGGGSSGDPGTGIGGPVDPAPVDPGTGQAKLVIPKPGQLNPRPLPAATLEASVDGRRVLVKATWWSGIEPCNVLDSVKVDRSGTDIAITLIEGTGDPNAICIEIAMQKATIVDLGELEPGTYTISSPGGDATPVVITIS
jgi:ABC-type transport system substrate-binding protein